MYSEQSQMTVHVCVGRLFCHRRKYYATLSNLTLCYIALLCLCLMQTVYNAICIGEVCVSQSASGVSIPIFRKVGNNKSCADCFTFYLSLPLHFHPPSINSLFTLLLVTDLELILDNTYHPSFAWPMDYMLPVCFSRVTYWVLAWLQLAFGAQLVMLCALGTGTIKIKVKFPYSTWNVGEVLLSFTQLLSWQGTNPKVPPVLWKLLITIAVCVLLNILIPTTWLCWWFRNLEVIIMIGIWPFFNEILLLHLFSIWPSLSLICYLLDECFDVMEKFEISSFR